MALTSRRQVHDQGRAGAGLAVSFNGPAVGEDDGFGDGEAEAAVAGGTAGFVGAVEAVEDVRQVGLGDARAGVCDGECGGAVVAVGADADLAAVVVVVDGVGEEVGDDLSKAVRVTLAEGLR